MAVTAAQVVEAAVVLLQEALEDQETLLPQVPLKEMMEAKEAMKQVPQDRVVAVEAQEHVVVM